MCTINFCFRILRREDKRITLHCNLGYWVIKTCDIVPEYSVQIGSYTAAVAVSHYFLSSFVSVPFRRKQSFALVSAMSAAEERELELARYVFVPESLGKYMLSSVSCLKLYSSGYTDELVADLLSTMTFLLSSRSS